MAKNIIYFHGFRSDSGSFKVEKIRAGLPNDCQLWTTNLSANPEVVQEQIINLVEQAGGATAAIYFMGSSLGGFYALVSGVKWNKPCFLINPALAPHKTLKSQVGKYKTYNLGLDYDFRATYVEVLKNYHDKTFQAIKDKPHPKEQFFTFFNEDDEVIHHSNFESYKSFLDYQILPNGGHQAANIEEIVGQIKERL